MLRFSKDNPPCAYLCMWAKHGGGKENFFWFIQRPGAVSFLFFFFGDDSGKGVRAESARGDLGSIVFRLTEE